VSNLSFQHTKSKWYKNPYAPSLDRIVPAHGYAPGNVRFVLEAVNVAMNQWGLETLLPILRAVLENHGDD